ncbi:MAG: nucleoside-diphosphate kinase [Deltaproteobacteria bacterium]|nr:nucleoside-diphosphate kinase [Deltaproteobacteria bacterium]
MLERTLGIVKPDGIRRGLIGEVLKRIEASGLMIVALRMKRLTREEAEGFYYVHREKPFFKDLVEFMTSGPVVLFVLEGENAIERYRKLMGATDPKKAEKGTIRADLAESMQCNTVHGSGGAETARFGISYFFPAIEIVKR